MRRDGDQAAELHQERAVAFERDHVAVGLGQRHPEGDAIASPMLPSM